ncbi:DUF4430 domain-containing protein [Sporanaerobacter acetigenes]|uniref:DUF4430 domain-containing protein n=1 Tax=Sporanaerobacter acetigenes TaxID=165813 RepID=UPI00332DFCEB
MKNKKFFLLLLLIAAIIVGGVHVFDIIGNYFFNEEAFAKSNKLEIEYWIDPNAKEIEKDEDNYSLLAQLRSQKNKIHTEKQENIEEIAEIESESKNNKKSVWEKLLESKKENKTSTRDEVKKIAKKGKEDNIDKEIIEEAEPVNSFQEEIKKAIEKQKDKLNKDKGSNEKEKQTTKEEERQKAIKEAKKEKERKKKEEREREKKENIVTMQIRCDTAVAKGMADDPKWQGIVPPSGVILPPTKFKIKEGDTVLDVLIMAKEQYKFHMSYRGSEASAYIEGINNLYEFDGGRWSGWMYCVNGWYPNYGAGVYVLKGGDVIEWNYTCDLGKDLGQDWLGD